LGGAEIILEGKGRELGADYEMQAWKMTHRESSYEILQMGRKGVFKKDSQENKRKKIRRYNNSHVMSPNRGKVPPTKRTWKKHARGKRERRFARDKRVPAGFRGR